MAKAYAQFSRMLQEQLLKGGNGSGGTPASAGGEVTIKAVGGPAAGSTVPPGDLPSPRTLAAMLTANSQQGTATILLLVGGPKGWGVRFWGLGCRWGCWGHGRGKHLELQAPGMA